MDVNDVKKPSSADEIVPKPAPSSRTNSAVNSANEPDKLPVAAVIEFDLSIRSTDIKQINSKLNEVIEAVNLASNATSDIEKLVKSIGGIIDQVDSGNLPANRRSILEDEANQLVLEIKVKANVETESGVRPLSGDKIRFELEQKLGKALEVILPDTAKNAFGLGKIGLSQKDAILQTRATVEAARQRLEELRKAVTDGQKDLEHTVNTVDVALQNSEASSVSVRDVDQALKLASDTKSAVGKSPEAAIGSIGRLKASALELLEG